jgi:hypothetical protein
VQQRVLALEVLDQLFLAVDRCGKPIDRRSGLGVDRRGVAQAIDRIMERIDRVHHRIVITQRARARPVNIAIELVFQHREAVDLGERTIERLGLRIDRAHRQPAQQQDKAGNDRCGRRHPHGVAPATGEPR